MAWSPEQRRQMEERIRERIEETRREMPRMEENAKPVAPDRALGRLTRMDAIGDKGVHEAALQNARARLSSLEVILQNLDDPAFGCCEICGRSIGFDRLMYLPESTRCVACASR